MGYVDHHSCTVVNPLSAADYIWLAALGSADRGPVSLDEIVLALDSLSGVLWQPTFEIIANNVDAMLAKDCLEDRGGALALTEAGRFRLTQLLAQPVQSPLSPFGQVGVRLKLAFLDLLPPLPRRRQIQSLITAYECEIASRSAQCRAWPLSGAIGRKWMDHTMDTLEDGLDLLRQSARSEFA